MARIAQPIDWFGLNHYCPIYARTDPSPLGFAWADAPHDVPLTGVGWRIDPNAFRDELITAYRRYKLPIYVTENGYGANETLDAAGGVNDPGRISYLRRLLQGDGAGPSRAAWTCAAISSGPCSTTSNGARAMPVASASSFVDYANQQRRVPKASFDWFAELIRAQQK